MPVHLDWYFFDFNNAPECRQMTGAERDTYRSILEGVWSGWGSVAGSVPPSVREIEALLPFRDQVVTDRILACLEPHPDDPSQLTHPKMLALVRAYLAHREVSVKGGIASGNRRTNRYRTGGSTERPTGGPTGGSTESEPSSEASHPLPSHPDEEGREDVDDEALRHPPRAREEHRLTEPGPSPPPTASPGRTSPSPLGGVGRREDPKGIEPPGRGEVSPELKSGGLRRGRGPKTPLEILTHPPFDLGAKLAEQLLAEQNFTVELLQRWQRFGEQNGMALAVHLMKRYRCPEDQPSPKPGPRKDESKEEFRAMAARVTREAMERAQKEESRGHME